MQLKSLFAAAALASVAIATCYPKYLETANQKSWKDNKATNAAVKMLVQDICRDGTLSGDYGDSEDRYGAY
ncbi:Uu.00g013090.m01.CDS01 [Anthostomella pinea]|uniref:Uu.00g013090.m01.CDS01 n=1 Tax=Anthostomella pinea TaxID=933095 RepID=A0AAI8YQA1_9PEZI|nr:Uu.00g013090.m01.CDS01 [Anthostomella pinea]